MTPIKQLASLCADASLSAVSSRVSVPAICFLGLCLPLVLNSGCAGLLHRSTANSEPLQNPLFIPPVEREFLWNQAVDAIDDYFRIEREDRVRLIGGVLTEGRIETFPTIGSTVFEPWRRDSTRGYEKFHATMQSIRRRASLRVIPTEGGYLLDVVVQKELEDLDKPEHATAGGATLRHDGTIVRQEGPPGRYSATLGWIPIGRDVTLEQRILADITARIDAPAHGGESPTLFEELFSPASEAAGPELKPAQPGMEELPSATRRLPAP